MKKSLNLLTLATTLVVLTVHTGVAAAQQKSEAKTPTPALQQRQTPKRDFGDKTTPGPVRIAPTPVKLMTGKVIRDNQSGKTFTVISNGKEVTFNAAKLKALPKVGEIVNITYTQTGSGPMEATNLNTSRSNVD